MQGIRWDSAVRDRPAGKDTAAIQEAHMLISRPWLTGLGTEAFWK
jgi:hypothetical protein